ncbi:TetR/AcrR family transcriptional regulator [Cohnella lupini]|uniref:TetR family transcriptional regulator n=1 Tax=Cohnella lupini TaxID=1294267 RepID=A0A3D9IVY1_9BACL|nr:TetR/AcrR family transcriptional regulator [Cohnella lupini]RED65855.1 TetR family transcriptional regulator [Cohnella lupini]
MKDPLEQWLEELLEKHEGERMTDKQSRILRAAVEVFAEKGYSGAATSEIAQRAGVAEGTIFRHYRTKKDLLYSIVAPFVARLIEPFVLRDLYPLIDNPHPTFEGFIRGILDNRIAFAEKNIKVIRILLQEVPFHPELREQFLSKVADRVLRKITNVVNHYREQGHIVEVPPLTAVRLVGSTLFGYLIVRFLFAPTGWDDSLEREATVQYILHGLSSRIEAK